MSTFDPNDDTDPTVAELCSRLRDAVDPPAMPPELPGRIVDHITAGEPATAVGQARRRPRRLGVVAVAAAVALIAGITAASLWAVQRGDDSQTPQLAAAIGDSAAVDSATATSEVSVSLAELEPFAATPAPTVAPPPVLRPPTQRPATPEEIEAAVAELLTGGSNALDQARADVAGTRQQLTQILSDRIAAVDNLIADLENTPAARVASDLLAAERGRLTRQLDELMAATDGLNLAAADAQTALDGLATTDDPAAIENAVDYINRDLSEVQQQLDQIATDVGSAPSPLSAQAEDSDVDAAVVDAIWAALLDNADQATTIPGADGDTWQLADIEIPGLGGSWTLEIRTDGDTTSVTATATTPSPLASTSTVVITASN